MTDLHAAEPDGPEVDLGSGRPARTIAVVLAVVLALLVVLLATRAPGSERATRSALLGRAAPETAGQTLQGEAFALADLRGRWVVVNFFQTTCIPCIEEHPELVRFAADHASIGDASLVSVLFDDRSDVARGFFEDNGGDWPVVIDEDGGIGVDYGVARVPESFLVSPTGIVVQRLVGGVTAAQLDEIIADFEAAAS